MKLLIVRHADPDYSIDSLTPTGWKEAELLSRRLESLSQAVFYVSPLGRARDTASLTLKRLGKTALTKEWLREFPTRLLHPGCEKPGPVWDWLPADWTKEPLFFDFEKWHTAPIMREAGVDLEYRRVTEEFDRLLASHGYKREGLTYRALCPNRDTLVFFCHFGVACVLLSRLLNISPMQLWHGSCALPSSVTTVVTEERRQGTASFRMLSFGDLSHLYAAGEEPSFAARFCETYDSDERHD